MLSWFHGHVVISNEVQFHVDRVHHEQCPLWLDVICSPCVECRQLGMMMVAENAMHKMKIHKIKRFSTFFLIEKKGVFLLPSGSSMCIPWLWKSMISPRLFRCPMFVHLHCPKLWQSTNSQSKSTSTITQRKVWISFWFAGTHTRRFKHQSAAGQQLIAASTAQLAYISDEWRKNQQKQRRLLSV